MKPLLSWLKKKEIDDIILFGSVLKGKKAVRDIDVAIVFNETSSKLWVGLNKMSDRYHFTKTRFSDLLEDPLLWQTLLHEGYSLKHKKKLSGIVGMKAFFLFEYGMDRLSKVERQSLNHALYGSGGRDSFLKGINGEKFGQKKVIVPDEESEEMRGFFETWNIAYTVKRVWM